MTIDEHLSWSEHINKLCNTLSRNFYLFYNIRNLIPHRLKRQLYFSLVYSRIQYGIEIYGTCQKGLIDKIQILQNKLLKTLYKLPYVTDTNKLHTRLNILKVKDIYKINVLKFVYESINHTSIEQFHNHYEYQSNRNNANLRNRNLLYPQTSNNKFGESTLKFQGTQLWNSLPVNLRFINSFYSFKKALRQKIMESYI